MTDEATTPKITQTSKQSHWFFWYTVILLGLTIAVFSDRPAMLPTVLIGNTILYVLPVWALKKWVFK